jgi:argininosuccinate lyase
MLANIQARDNILEDERYKYLFSVEAVNLLVNQGVPFREAYKQVGNEIGKGSFHFDFAHQLHHTHTGSIGRLANEEITAEMRKVLEKFVA